MLPLNVAKSRKQSHKTMLNKTDLKKSNTDRE
jgi:hypothetical protein